MLLPNCRKDVGGETIIFGNCSICSDSVRGEVVSDLPSRRMGLPNSPDVILGIRHSKTVWVRN
ncbi:unnamed protein product, partial [Allacma fusca]